MPVVSNPTTRRLRAAISTVVVMVTLMAVLVLPAAAQAQAEDGAPTSGAARIAYMGFDAVILRPVSFVVLVAGSLMFVPAAVITAPNGWHSITEAREIFIDNPAEYVFQRGLGEF